MISVSFSSYSEPKKTKARMISFYFNYFNWSQFIIVIASRVKYEKSLTSFLTASSEVGNFSLSISMNLCKPIVWTMNPGPEYVVPFARRGKYWGYY
jgi:hypothetical protein